MNFIGIDLHTNRFTCCYRNERSSVIDPAKDRVLKTFELNEQGLAAFYATLTADTYVLVESTITTFSFVRLFKNQVKEVIIANTYELKQISLARCNTDKIDADKLCRIIKMQILSGEQTISPVTLPPPEIQELRSLFSTYRLYQKQNTQLKNRIHSLLKEQLYGFTQEEIFDRKSRQKIREISDNAALRFQLNQLMDRLERDEADVESLKEQVLLHAAPFMAQIELLTSLKGVSVFIAIAIIADIIDISRFRNSKAFTSYLRSAPHVANSNTSTSIRGTNKQGRKLSATLLTQSLNHVMAASPKLRRWYDRLAEYKKPGLVRTGLRRRVFAEIFQMLKKGEYHYGREPQKHEAKMAQYRRFLEKQKSQEIFLKSA
ncbi:IS110 family transposase [Spirochaetia bacterium]|nr:IS110 family transposase [Spirochaetia bacterium]